jgi:hypothetical protein
MFHFRPFSLAWCAIRRKKDYEVPLGAAKVSEKKEPAGREAQD